MMSILLLLFVTLIGVFSVSPSFGLFFFACYYCGFLVALISKRITTVDLFFLFYSLYLLFGVLFFAVAFFQDIVCEVVTEGCFDLNSELSVVYSCILTTALTPCYLALKSSRVREGLDDGVGLSYRASTLLGVIAIFMVLITSSYSIYLYYLTGGAYIFWSGVDSSYFNALGWLTILSLSVIVLAFNHLDYKKLYVFYVLVFVLIVVLALLHIRIYAAAVLFSLLLNMEIRGFRFDKKALIILIIVFAGVLAQSVFRFQNFDYSDVKNLAFTLSGEFLLPHISSFYLMQNPFGINSSFSVTDLFTQLLPSDMRPYPELYSFRDEYIKAGVHPWPIGGIFFIAQLYYFFSYFGIGVYLLLFFSIIRLKTSLSRGNYTIWYAVLPPLFMILPRIELWTLRACLVNMLLLMFIKYVLKR